jgi:hypothetical protein
VRLSRQAACPGYELHIARGDHPLVEGANRASQAEDLSEGASLDDAPLKA